MIHKLLVSVALTGVVAAVLAYGWSTLRPGDAAVASRLCNAATAVDDDRVEHLIGRFPVEAPVHVRTLVELACSQRAAVARAAQRRIDDWLDHATRQATSATSTAKDAVSGQFELLEILAEELAAASDRLGPVAGAWNRRVALRLVQLVPTSPPRHRQPMLKHLATIIDGGRPQGSRLTAEANLLRQRDQTWQRRSGGHNGQLAHALGEPGNALPLFDESIESLRQPRVADQRPLNQPHAGKSGLDLPTRPRHGLEVDEPSAVSNPGQYDDGPLPWRSENLQPFARIQSWAASTDAIDVPAPDRWNAMRDQFLDAPLSEVLDSLVDGDRYRSSAAEAALERRGMSKADIRFAQVIATAQPSERLESIERLLNIPGTRTTAWLNFFARDTSAEVRMRALTLLATSADPAVRRRAAAMAENDQDASVRKLANQFAR